MWPGSSAHDPPTVSSPGVTAFQAKSETRSLTF
jgi:hypothetical protein